ncbi:MAG: hypothetical protein V2A77_09040 [Pseudomonadota bacterium]
MPENIEDNLPPEIRAANETAWAEYFEAHPEDQGKLRAIPDAVRLANEAAWAKHYGIRQG